ncbi:hypothetical protein HDV00_004253 [Rhizophlyctis rosea]|nr:hypothetical protein HDV00_004253 [Rhizophlyctis rosea]
MNCHGVCEMCYRKLNRDVCPTCRDSIVRAAQIFRSGNIKNVTPGESDSDTDGEMEDGDEEGTDDSNSDEEDVEEDSSSDEEDSESDDTD